MGGGGYNMALFGQLCPASKSWCSSSITENVLIPMYTYCAGVAKKMPNNRRTVTYHIRGETGGGGHTLVTFGQLCPGNKSLRSSCSFSACEWSFWLKLHQFEVNTLVFQSKHTCCSGWSPYSALLSCLPKSSLNDVPNWTRCVWPTCLCWGLSCLNCQYFVLEKISACLFCVEFCRGSVYWHAKVV